MNGCEHGFWNWILGDESDFYKETNRKTPLEYMNSGDSEKGLVVAQSCAEGNTKDNLTDKGNLNGDLEISADILGKGKFLVSCRRKMKNCAKYGKSI